jgi:hypothetical protein
MLPDVNPAALRWRRLGAGVVDFTPFLLAVGAVQLALVTMGLVAFERFFGVGIFDPALGTDPVLASHLVGQRATALGATVGMVAWVALQAVVLARRQGSIGKRLFALTAESSDGKSLGGWRAMLREMPRHGLALGVMAGVALAAAPRPAMSAPRLYARVSEWYSPIVSVTIAAPLVVLLLTALAIHLAVDILLLLAGRRSLADRLAQTRISSVAAV